MGITGVVGHVSNLLGSLFHPLVQEFQLVPEVKKRNRLQATEGEEKRSGTKEKDWSNIA